MIIEQDISTITTELELRLQDAWDSYIDENLTTSNFPKTVAHLYGPQDDGMLSQCTQDFNFCVAQYEPQLWTQRTKYKQYKRVLCRPGADYFEK